MRFQKKGKIDKTILVISDLHLGAGADFEGRGNLLEDFHHDRELVEFLKYYSTGAYGNRPVELIINGDFLDFLAVPFVPYFDDEFWSESAALDKLKIILNGHREIMSALDKFLCQKEKNIVYIIGNHDGEMILERVQKHFLSKLSKLAREGMTFYLEGEYRPIAGIVIKHGHEYEIAHNFDNKESTIVSTKGEKYFVPPWGSYYVTRVINKFKEERSYINQVWPIRAYIIYGLIFDTLFTLRFFFATIYYFIMVRFLDIYQSNKSLKEILRNISRELELFHDSEHLAASFFQENDAKALILGHTHRAMFRPWGDGRFIINTGTWTKTANLDFFNTQPGINLTYCQIDSYKRQKDQVEPFDHLMVALNSWQGKREFPYVDFDISSGKD